MAFDLFTSQIVKKDFLIENILTPIFGYQSQDPSPYAQIMAVFSGAITVVAAVLLIFSFVQKLMNTAREGSLKTVQATTIIRWLVGLVLLIPMPPSNFGLGVQGVVWLAGQGVNLANVAYERWDLSTTLTNKDLSYSTNYNNQLLSILKTAVSSHLCVNSAAENYALKSNGDKPNFSFAAKSIVANQVTYSFGDIASKASSDRAICGHLTISYPAAEAKNRTVNSEKLINWADQSLVNDAELKNSLKNSHIAAVKNLIEVDAAKIAKSVKKVSSEQLSAQIEQALQNYNNTIKNTFNSLSIFNKEVNNKMKESGIAGAGAWFFKVSLINQQINKAVNNLPSVNSLKTSSENEKNCSWYSFLGTNCQNAKRLTEYSTNIASDQEIFEHRFTEALKHLSANSADKKIATAAAQDKKSDLEADFLDLFKPISNVDFNRLNAIDDITKNVGNPLIKIQSIGQDLATAVQAIILGLVAFSWTGVVAAVAVVVMPFLLGILIPGLLLAFYVPLLPFITWLGALVGWIVMLSMAVFGVPLWLLAHMIPDQEGLIGKTGQGYLLILELFLKPVLLFAGYLSALFLLNPVMLLLNSFFGFAAESIFDETSSFLYVLYLISIFCIYFVIVNQLLKLLLNLMTEIPDSIFNWLGSNVNKLLSSYGHQLDERSTHSTGTALAHSTAALGQISNAATSLFKLSKVDKKADKNSILDNSSNTAEKQLFTQKNEEKSSLDTTQQANTKQEVNKLKTEQKTNTKEETLKAKIKEDLNKSDDELSAYRKNRIKRNLNKLDV